MKVIMVILILIILGTVYGILWALPLYLSVNFVAWVFHASFHLTLLQSFAICLLINVVRILLFGKMEISTEREG